MFEAIINLVPAYVKKEGPSFDLPIALGAGDALAVALDLVHGATARAL